MPWWLMHEFLSAFLSCLCSLSAPLLWAEDHYLLCKALCPFSIVLGLSASSILFPSISYISVARFGEQLHAWVTCHDSGCPSGVIYPSQKNSQKEQQHIQVLLTVLVHFIHYINSIGPFSTENTFNFGNMKWKL